MINALYDKFPCRNLQIDQIVNLFSHECNPSTLAVYGSTATGKSAVVRDVLCSLLIPYGVVSIGECITLRHLFERILNASLSLNPREFSDSTRKYLLSRCDNINGLSTALQGSLEGCERVVLILDDINKGREIPSTILTALSKLGNTISALTVILVMTTTSSRSLRLAGIPYIYFPPYSREESIKILLNPVPQIFLKHPTVDPSYTEELALEDDEWVWLRYLEVLWDSLAKDTAKDIVKFRSLAEKLWRPFVAPIVDGTLGTRDFSRLLISRRLVFQDEEILAEHIEQNISHGVSSLRKNILHDLPFYSKYLLCAAYLASYSAARQDTTFFMKSHEKRRKRKLGVVGTTRKAGHRKIPRHLLSPSPFTLDRLLAIFRSIAPNPISQTSECHVHLATLKSLRLLTRTGVATDALDLTCKWRVNFGLDYATALGRSVGFELIEFLPPSE